MLLFESQDQLQEFWATTFKNLHSIDIIVIGGLLIFIYFKVQIYASIFNKYQGYHLCGLGESPHVFGDRFNVNIAPSHIHPPMSFAHLVRIKMSNFNHFKYNT